MNPVKAVAGVFEIGAEGSYVFLGTCFAYRRANAFLTAKHVVQRNRALALVVCSPLDRVVRPVRRALGHESADVALLKTDEADGVIIEPFPYVISNYALGEDFAAFGLPEDAVGPSAGSPVPRLIKGHFQRFLEYSSPFGYRYAAAELSTPCPRGLSGSPVFRDDPDVLIGLVTENVEVATEHHEMEERRAGAVLERTVYRRVVQYGIAMLLDKVEPWLDENIPRPEEGNESLGPA